MKYNLIDLTSLNDTDDENSIIALCQKAIELKCAAVCVMPKWIDFVRKNKIKIATVANFPHGTDSLENVLPIIDQALSAGADEIDVVFPYLQYLHGEKTAALNFIRACKACCEKNILKVILETGYADNTDWILPASVALIDAGADFLKTSTGKIATGATLPAVTRILTALQKNPTVGIKISGGIRTEEQIHTFLRAITAKMGENWISPEHVRFGISGAKITVIPTKVG